jgi:hypothetical protein
MPRRAVQARIVEEVSVDSGVDLNPQFEIKLVQELFLVREIGKERASGNSRPSGDLRRRREESGLGDLVYCRLEDCVAFLRASDFSSSGVGVMAAMCLQLRVPMQPRRPRSTNYIRCLPTGAPVKAPETLTEKYPLLKKIAA